MTNYQDFINDDELHGLLASEAPVHSNEVRQVISRALAKEPLTVRETALLLRAEDPELVEEIFAAARTLKERVYGNRIVLFAPLYIGNRCINDCTYCAFRVTNKEVQRRTLNKKEVAGQVEALANKGHKRLILVFGEHPKYDAKFIADTVKNVYSVQAGNGEIRRVNINAAPLNVADYKKVKEAGIGTYQVFQETYHHETYKKVHPGTKNKADYHWRVTSLHRAMEAGCDDVGIGALFGLYDWRFEVLGLVSHAVHLHETFGVGPHTISFPRLRPAAGVDMDERWAVNDEDFKRLIAILRLAVPYTGLILTAREEPALRRELMEFGVSQIDAGSRIEIGGYTEAGDGQCMEREQFHLGDIRSLDEVMGELLEDGYLPSFCTACYRLGRTGEHFMEFAIPGFIKRYCTPNALTTLAEYLADYAGKDTYAAGMNLLENELSKIEDEKEREKLRKVLEEVLTTNRRDIYF